MGVIGGESYNVAEHIVSKFDESEQYIDPVILDQIKYERGVSEINIFVD